MTCDKCNLELPDRLVFKCDKHCAKQLCITHLKEHAAEVSMTYRTIPKMMKGAK